MNDYAHGKKLDRLETTVVAMKGEIQRLEEAHAAMASRIERIEDDLYTDKVLESPAAAPDPVCQCGTGEAYMTPRGDKCELCHRFKVVPTAEPEPALDPVNMAVNELCDIVSSLAMGTVHMIGGNVAGKILERVEVIRAIFPDGRDGAR